MVATSTDVANQALVYMGYDSQPVTGLAPTFDNSPAGQALAKLYAPAVASVARQFEWDFARSTVALTLSGNAAPIPFAYEYLYPSNGVQVWQLIPAAADPNNPLPSDWDVANVLVGGVQTKVIQSNTPAALAVYNNNPTEATWDPTFREAVVRLLASELAMALAGKPDTSQNLLESGSAFANQGAERDS